MGVAAAFPLTPSLLKGGRGCFSDHPELVEGWAEKRLPYALARHIQVKGAKSPNICYNAFN